MITFDCVGSNLEFKTLSAVKGSTRSSLFEYKGGYITGTGTFHFPFRMMKQHEMPLNES